LINYFVLYGKRHIFFKILGLLPIRFGPRPEARHSGPEAWGSRPKRLGQTTENRVFRPKFLGLRPKYFGPLPDAWDPQPDAWGTRPKYFQSKMICKVKITNKYGKMLCFWVIFTISLPSTPLGINQ